MNQSLGGIILCGGQSRRMGRSKASLPFGPESMLERVVRVVREVALPVIVVASAGQDLPELVDDVVVVRDPIAGLGPLHGIVTGLAALPESVEFAFVASTDVPFLQTSWINHLLRSIGQNDLAIAEVGGFRHPLVALYRREPALKVSRRLIQGQHRRLLDLADQLSSIMIDERSINQADPGLSSLRNLNTPEDYRSALREAGHSS